MSYAVVSTLVRDEVYRPDGTLARQALGGAGLYALCGLRLFANNSLLITGVGEDFSGGLDGWFLTNNISTRGLFRADRHTALNRVCYREDGERSETALYGPGHYRKMEARPEQLAPFCGELDGMYVFKDFGPEGYWEEMLRLKQKHGYPLLWELNADLAAPQHLPRVREIAQKLEIFSVNRTEATRLLGVPSLAEAAMELLSWGLPLVYLRAGKSGALLLAGGRCVHVPAATHLRVEDVTGGGNSSSAAVLYAYSRGLSPAECGAYGSAAAAFCIAQYGPPPLLDAAAREEALRLKDETLKQAKEGIPAC